MTENQNTETSTLEFEVNVKTFNKEKNELVETFSAGAKVTKADAGRESFHYEDITKINIFAKQDVYESPRVSIKTTTKMTKADSGKV